MEHKEWVAYLFIHCLCLEVLSVHASTWTAEVPRTVPALLGSCVVVPCKFSYPETVRAPAAALEGIWHTDNSYDHDVYHPDPSKVIEKFRGRTQLIGNLQNKNCSLRIYHLKKEDTGPFVFRILIKDFDKYSYKDSKVTINVQDSPASPSLNVTGEVSSGKAVTISCSVSHTCPSEPPQITWSHNGTLNIQSEQLQPPNGQWKVTSVLTFTPTIADHNKKVTCTAEYPLRSISKSAQASQLLSVKYAPVSVRAETETPVVKEGDSVQLVCSSDSNPKAHSYQWYDVTGSLQSKERILTLQKVPRNTGAFYCTASNSEGSGKSSLVKVHVEYAPEIKEGSACTTTVTGVTCVCIVDSVPPPEIRWLFLGGALPSSGTERHGSVSRGTFQNPHRLSDHITCQASTSRGNSTISLPIPHTDKLQYILIAVVLLLAAVGVVIWFVRRKRNHDQAVVDKKDEEVSTETATYATTVRKKHKHSASTVHADDQQMYGNVEVGEDCAVYTSVDDDIYANV